MNRDLARALIVARENQQESAPEVVAASVEALVKFLVEFFGLYAEDETPIKRFILSEQSTVSLRLDYTITEIEDRAEI